MDLSAATNEPATQNRMTQNDCRAPLPYPEVKAVGKNKKTANILLKLYSGKVSEMTASTQYSFQHIVMDGVNKEIADTMHCIGIVEMTHLKMLGEVIRQLGEVPKFGYYADKNFIYWSGGNVNYSDSEGKLLLTNLADERKAITDYQAAIASIEDEEITALLKRIILDEEHHIEILTALYQKYAYA